MESALGPEVELALEPEVELALEPEPALLFHPSRMAFRNLQSRLQQEHR